MTAIATSFWLGVTYQFHFSDLWLWLDLWLWWNAFNWCMVIYALWFRLFLFARILTVDSWLFQGGCDIWFSCFKNLLSEHVLYCSVICSQLQYFSATEVQRWMNVCWDWNRVHCTKISLSVPYLEWNGIHGSCARSYGLNNFLWLFCYLW